MHQIFEACQKKHQKCLKINLGKAWISPFGPKPVEKDKEKQDYSIGSLANRPFFEAEIFICF